MHSFIQSTYSTLLILHSLVTKKEIAQADRCRTVPVPAGSAFIQTGRRRHNASDVHNMSLELRMAQQRTMLKIMPKIVIPAVATASIPTIWKW